MNYLITGYHGEPHVTAENDRGFNASVFGSGKYVLPVGEQFRAEYIGNNTVRVYDGKLIDNGAIAGIPAGKYIDLLIPEAGQGMKRNDLIVFQYSRDASTLIETGSFVVLSGTETTGAAADPAILEEDLLADTATFDQFALWRVAVSGASISDPVPLFKVSRNITDMTVIAPDILHNSNWEKVVNQRGKTSYSGLGYSIDRWIVPSSNAALTVGDGFVLIQNDSTTETALFTQRLEPGTLKTGKAYTAVIYLNDGTIISGSAVCASGGSVLTDTTKDVYVQIAPSTNYDNFRLNVNAGKYARIKHVALYEGEYTEETLPEYQPKGYGAELLECQRYYRELNVGYETAILGVEKVFTLKHYGMRTIPTVTIVNHITGSEGSVSNFANGGEFPTAIRSAQKDVTTLGANTGEAGKTYVFRYKLYADL